MKKDISRITPENLPVLQYAGRRVITTSLLASVYGTDEHNIIKNYTSNQGRFSLGKHYFKLEGDDLRWFKDNVTQSDVVRKRAKHLILWTERGAARHAKMLDTEQSWEIFEKMEDCYFAHSEQAKALLQAPVGLTPVQQRHIQQCVSHLAKHPGSSHQSVYSSIKDRFMVGTYKDIPSEKYPELCRFLGSEPLEGEWIGPKEPEKPVSRGVIELDADETQDLYLIMCHLGRLVDMHPIFHKVGSALGSPVMIEAFTSLYDVQGHWSRLKKSKGESLAQIHQQRMSRH